MISLQLRDSAGFATNFPPYVCWLFSIRADRYTGILPLFGTFDKKPSAYSPNSIFSYKSASEISTATDVKLSRSPIQLYSEKIHLFASVLEYCSTCSRYWSINKYS